LLLQAKSGHEIIKGGELTVTNYATVAPHFVSYVASNLK